MISVQDNDNLQSPCIAPSRMGGAGAAAAIRTRHFNYAHLSAPISCPHRPIRVTQGRAGCRQPGGRADTVHTRHGLIDVTQVDGEWLQLQRSCGGGQVRGQARCNLAREDRHRVSAVESSLQFSDVTVTTGYGAFLLRVVDATRMACCCGMYLRATINEGELSMRCSRRRWPSTRDPNSMRRRL